MSDATSAAAAGLIPREAAPAERLRGPLLALAVGVGLVAGARALAAAPGGDALALWLVLGALFGFVLQRSRFCFQCLWRDLGEGGDARGALGVLAALAVGMAGHAAVFGAFLPDPSSGRLPPGAHVGPVGPVLVLAGLLFGAGMAVSGSCISAHLYRLGEGSPTAPFALAGSALGFGLGFRAWNPLYLASIADAPVVWLPRHLGYAGALGLGLLALGLLALLLLRRAPPEPAPRGAAPPGPASPAREALRAVFVRRWPAWAGGLAVGALATVAYFRVGALGVTAEIGSRARQGADALGLLPARLEGLDALRGCATAVRDALLTPNGLFVGGLVLASFAAALAAGQFRPARPTAAQAARGLLGGALLGFGAMIGLGCTVGTFLSGVMAGAASGWVFAAAALAGTAATGAAGRRLGLLA